MNEQVLGPGSPTDQLIREMKKREKYRNLEITCLGNSIHTGSDVKVMLDGESILSNYSITKIDFEVTSDSSKIIIYHVKNPETGSYYLDRNKDRLVEQLVTITYPIKKIKIDYKHFGVESDNTPIGTKFFVDGKEIKKPGIVEFSTTIGDADTITEYTITGC